MLIDRVVNRVQSIVYDDGILTRDPIHVSDIVRTLLVMCGLDDECSYCRGEAVDFNEIVDKLNDARGTDIEPQYIEPPLAGDYVATYEGDHLS